MATFQRSSAVVFLKDKRLQQVEDHTPILILKRILLKKQILKSWDALLDGKSEKTAVPTASMGQIEKGV
jgi:hypothetical protein